MPTRLDGSWDWPIWLDPELVSHWPIIGRDSLRAVVPAPRETTKSGDFNKASLAAVPALSYIS